MFHFVLTDAITSEATLKDEVVLNLTLVHLSRYMFLLLLYIYIEGVIYKIRG